MCQNRPKQYVEPNRIVTAGSGVLRHCESVRTRQRAQTLLDDGGQFLWACSIAHAHADEAACKREQVLHPVVHLTQQQALPLLGLLALRNVARDRGVADRSEEHTSALQSLMRISYDVFCLQKKKQRARNYHN